MYFADLHSWLSLITNAIAMLALADAARRAHWSGSLREHAIWALATAVTLLGHRASFALPGGGELHYLGAACLTLLLGYPRAVLSMAAVLLIEMLWRDAPLSAWGLQVLLGGVMPAWLIWAMVRICRRRLPRNLFVFLLGCGLLGIAASNMLQLLAGTAAMAWLGPQTAAELWGQYLPFGLLLSWGEAVIEGMMITLAVVYAPPGTVRLFDESFYLGHEGPGG